MDSILKSIEDWIRSMLVSGIMDNIERFLGHEQDAQTHKRHEVERSSSNR